MQSRQEIRRIVEGYEASGLTRRQYCQKHRIPVSTLDYWRRVRHRKRRLVPVAIEPPPRGPGFVVVLANGRRIESSWSFAEAELQRLIRIVESA